MTDIEEILSARGQKAGKIAGWPMWSNRAGFLCGMSFWHDPVERWEPSDLSEYELVAIVEKHWREWLWKKHGALATKTAEDGSTGIGCVPLTGETIMLCEASYISALISAILATEEKT